MTIPGFPLTQIPAQTAVTANKGLVANQWYFYLNQERNFLEYLIANGPFVQAGSGGGGSTTIFSGTYAELGVPGANGDVYFTTDTGQIFIGEGGVWIQETPAYSGDVSSGAGTTVLTLNTVNPITFGTFTNATITVNDKGLITYAASGVPPELAVGPPGTIQFAGTSGTFDGDATNFFYSAMPIPTVNLGNGYGTGILTLGSGGEYIQGDNVGNLTLGSTATTGFNINPSGALGIGVVTPDYGTANQALLSEGSSSPPAWQNIVNEIIAGTGISVSSATGDVTITNTGVLSFSGDSTGLTPSTPTTGNVVLGGVLNYPYGGTGLSATPTNGELLIGNGAGYTLATLSTGVGISVTNGAGSITITNTGVLSFDLNDDSTTPIYTVTPTTPTTGNVAATMTLNTQAKNLFFAGPNSGSAAQPTFRALSNYDIYPALVEALVAGNNITLTDNSTLDTITITAVPTAPVNSIQFNYPLGTFAGSSALTYQDNFPWPGPGGGDEGNTLILGNTNSTFTIYSQALYLQIVGELPNGAGGGNISILGGNAGTPFTGPNINGGSVAINGGSANGFGAGGAITIESGEGGNAGPIDIFGGPGGGIGGSGGTITITAGAGGDGGTGGALNLSAGNVDNLLTPLAGNLTLAAGQSGSAQSRSGVITFTTNGTLRFTIDNYGTWLLASSAGTSGQVLTSQGTNTPPIWTTNQPITVTGGTGLFVTGSPVSLGGTVTLSNTGVTSAVAGTGISVSSATGAVTIGNTGVTQIIAGTNISITPSGGTGNVTINTSGSGVLSLSTGTTGLLANGVTSAVVGAVTLSGVLNIANGGTGQTSASAAFGALSPLTTTGDLITYAGGTNIRVAAGSTGQVLTMSSGTPTWETLVLPSTVYNYTAVPSAFSFTVANTTWNQIINLSGNTTITFTAYLPPLPTDGQVVSFSFVNTTGVSGIVVGSTSIPIVASGLGLTHHSYIYDSSTNTWYQFS
jgi:hypothetical protein